MKKQLTLKVKPSEATDDNYHLSLQKA